MHFEARLIGAKAVERHIAVFVLLIDTAPNGVARKCRGRNPAPKAHRRAFDKQASRKPRASPVAQSMPSPVVIISRLASSCLAILGLRLKPSGTRASALPISRSVSSGNAGLAVAVVARRDFEPLPLAFQPIGLVGLVAGRGLKSFSSPARKSALILSVSACGNAPSATSFCGIDFARRRHVLDLAVHDRLGESRFVAFVMAVAAIADHVDDDVLAGISGGIRRPCSRDMHDRLRHRRRSHGKSAPGCILATSVQ